MLALTSEMPRETRSPKGLQGLVEESLVRFVAGLDRTPKGPTGLKRAW